jgi:hypothetical protein
MRYGTMISIVALAIGTAVVMRDRLLTRRRAIGVTAAIFAVLLAPHAVIATIARGSPWAILTTAQGATGRADGLPAIQYLGWFPWQLMGPLGAAIAAAGIVAIVRTIIRRPPSTTLESRFCVFTGIVAAIHLATLGTAVHAEPRYVLFPMTLLIITGAVALVPTVAHLLERPKIASAAVTVAAVALLLGASVAVAEVRDRQASWDWKRTVGLAIRDAGQGDCSVMAADVPIMAWYSECPAYNFVSAPANDPLSLLHGNHRYVVLAVDGEHQPDGRTWHELYLPHLDPWRSFDSGRGAEAAEVYEVAASPDR